MRYLSLVGVNKSADDLLEDTDDVYEYEITPIIHDYYESKIIFKLALGIDTLSMKHQIAFMHNIKITKGAAIKLRKFMGSKYVIYILNH